MEEVSQDLTCKGQDLRKPSRYILVLNEESADMERRKFLTQQLGLQQMRQ
jgi:hypothetical protein